jgi:hypothetical protein
LLLLGVWEASEVSLFFRRSLELECIVIMVDLLVCFVSLLASKSVSCFSLFDSEISLDGVILLARLVR